MVSQISLGEQQMCNPSNMHQPQQCISMDNRTFTKATLEDVHTKVEESAVIKSNQKLSPIPPYVTAACQSPNPSVYKQKTPSKDPNRLVTLGDDIILEEEEETAAPPQQEPSTSKIEKAGALKKVPYYGQNINVTPDNEEDKLTDKPKI
uniref:Uncharacterized protein n=1 Tax=Ceratitis capitata TaxID=7213 RepID=W8AQY3_CERCA